MVNALRLKLFKRRNRSSIYFLIIVRIKRNILTFRITIFKSTVTLLQFMLLFKILDTKRVI